MHLNLQSLASFNRQGEGLPQTPPSTDFGQPVQGFVCLLFFFGLNKVIGFYKTGARNHEREPQQDPTLKATVCANSTNDRSLSWTIDHFGSKPLTRSRCNRCEGVSIGDQSEESGDFTGLPCLSAKPAPFAARRQNHRLWGCASGRAAGRIGHRGRTHTTPYVVLGRADFDVGLGL